MFLPDFIQIPSKLLLNKNLRPTDRILYGVIYWMVRLKDGHCYAGNLSLSELCQVTPRAIQAGLQRLEQNGYIQRKLVMLKNGRLTRDEIIPLVVLSSQPIRTNVREGVRTNVRQNKSSPKKNIYTNKFKEMRSQLIRSKSL